MFTGRVLYLEDTWYRRVISKPEHPFQLSFWSLLCHSTADPVWQLLNRTAERHWAAQKLEESSSIPNSSFPSLQQLFLLAEPFTGCVNNWLLSPTVTKFISSFPSLFSNFPFSDLANFFSVFPQQTALLRSPKCSPLHLFAASLGKPDPSCHLRPKQSGIKHVPEQTALARTSLSTCLIFYSTLVGIWFSLVSE